MKKLLLLAAIALMLGSCGTKNGYSIKGSVEGLEGNMVYLMTDDEMVIDSTRLKNGNFSFKGEVDDYPVLLLSDENGTFAMVFAERGTIDVAGRLEQYNGIEVSGTPSNDRYNEFVTSRSSLVERFYSSSEEEERNQIMEEDRVNSEAAVDDNLDNIFGLYMLNEISYAWDANRILDKLKKFSPEMQATKLSADIASNARAKLRTEIGQPYIEIVLPDMDGTNRALSSLVGEGKYVLIDFWASWCGPCLMEIPYLVDAYKKYHKKGFEIFGVSLDRGVAEWKAAVKDNNMDWVQVSIIDVQDSTTPGDYSVYSIPANYLVDPDGIIIAKNLRGEEVEQKIAELLGN